MVDGILVALWVNSELDDTLVGMIELTLVVGLVKMAADWLGFKLTEGEPIAETFALFPEGVRVREGFNEFVYVDKLNPLEFFRTTLIV